jgi:hypothetical protein
VKKEEEEEKVSGLMGREERRKKGNKKSSLFLVIRLQNLFLLFIPSLSWGSSNGIVDLQSTGSCSSLFIPDPLL